MTEVVLRLVPLNASSLRCCLTLSDGLEPLNLTVGEFRARFEFEACTLAQVHAVAVEGTVSRVRSSSNMTFADLTDDNAQAKVQAVVEEAHLTSGISGNALTLLLRRHSRVRIVGKPGRTRTGELSLFASGVSLLRLPPEPAAVLKAARLVACSFLASEVAAAAFGMAVEDLQELVHALETSVDADAESERLARGLSSRLRGETKRERPPKFSRDEWRILERLGRRHGSQQPEYAEELVPADQVSALLRGPLNPERGIPAGLPASEATLRRTYLREKKVPQLRWMLWQLQPLLDARTAQANTPLCAEEAACRVLDLGCGKGDFSLLIAAARPDARVVGIDSNADAIAAAQARASESSLPNARFLCGDASELLAALQRSDVPDRQAKPTANLCDAVGRVDVLVALHACGGLSDVALELAARCGAAALVCTCCFNKHRGLSGASRWEIGEAEKDVLCRMADCVEPALSAEARRVISCMRLARAQTVSRLHTDAGGVARDARIRTFPMAFSRQNFVLVLGARCEDCVE